MGGGATYKYRLPLYMPTAYYRVFHGAGARVERNVAALIAFNAFRGAAVGGMMALFTLYMSWLGYSMSDIGVAITASNMVSVATLPLIGYLIDVYSPRLMAFATGIMLSLALIILTMQPSYIILIAAYSLFLLSFFYGQPARMSFLAKSISLSTLGSSIGVTSAVFSASRTIGPTLGGYSAETIGFKDTFLILSILALLGSFVFLALSREPAGFKRQKATFAGVVRSYKTLLKPPESVRKVFLYVGMDRFAWSLWFPMISAHLYTNGYQESLVGLVLSAQSLVQSIALPLTGRLVDVMGPRISLASSEIVGVGSALLLSNPESPVIAFTAMILLGFSIALWIPGYNTLIAGIVGRGEVGRSYASANVYRSIASTPSPYIGGTLYDALSHTAPFILSSILFVALAYYILVYIRNPSGLGKA